MELQFESNKSAIVNEKERIINEINYDSREALVRLENTLNKQKADNSTQTNFEEKKLDEQDQIGDDT